MGMPNELVLEYPAAWEDEYKNTRTVEVWHRDYPDQFEEGSLSANPGTLDLFAQYALMYLLRRDYGVYSLTWYKLTNISPKSRNRERSDRCWELMREWMGTERFERLQSALLNAGFREFAGEPDLFCWHRDSGQWFFAEAKRKDQITETQMKWFSVCRKALGNDVDIRVYRVVRGPK